MTIKFTLLSALLLLAVGLGVLIEVLRGMGRGLSRTALGLSTVLLAALAAMPLAVWLSDYPSAALGRLLDGALPPSLDTYREHFPRVFGLTTAMADALLTPFLFVALYLVLRLILRVIVAAVARARLRKLPDSPRVAPVGIYAEEDAPWYRRYDRLLGGVVGGICGFIATLILLVPLLGIQSVGSTLLRSTEKANYNWAAMGVEESLLEEEIKPYVYDPVATVLNAMGGEVIYSGVARSTLAGETVCLPREVEACSTLVIDMFSAFKTLNRLDTATPAQRETLATLGDRIDDSAVMRVVGADFLNGAAGAWLDGKLYFKIARPACGELMDPILDSALRVCAESTPDCVGRDVSTILNVYLIVVDYGLLSNPDAETLLEGLGEDSVLDAIYAELLKNPCMAHLTGELTSMALRLMAEAIEWGNLSDNVYKGLMADLAESLNLVDSMGGLDHEGRVEAMSQYAMHYAGQYGIALPESLAQLAAAELVGQMGNSGDKLTADDLDDFFNQYLGGD